MNISVTVRHGSVPDDVRSHAEDRAKRLLRFMDRIHSVELVLEAVTESHHDAHRCEIIVPLVKGQVLTAEVVGADWTAAIDHAAQKMERKLRRFKQQLRDDRRRSSRRLAAVRTPPSDASPAEGDDPSWGDVVDRRAE